VPHPVEAAVSCVARGRSQAERRERSSAERARGKRHYRAFRPYTVQFARARRRSASPSGGETSRHPGRLTSSPHACPRCGRVLRGCSCPQRERMGRARDRASRCWRRRQDTAADRNRDWRICTDGLRNDLPTRRRRPRLLDRPDVRRHRLGAAVAGISARFRRNDHCRRVEPEPRRHDGLGRQPHGLWTHDMASRGGGTLAPSRCDPWLGIDMGFAALRDSAEIFGPGGGRVGPVSTTQFAPAGGAAVGVDFTDTSFLGPNWPAGQRKGRCSLCNGSTSTSITARWPASRRRLVRRNTSSVTAV
jgi:hypothetical protein